MLTSLGNAIYHRLDVRKASLFFTLGVFLASLATPDGDYLYWILSILLLCIIILLFQRPQENILFFCGLFIYYLSTISTELSVPHIIYNIGQKFGGYIEGLPMRHSNLAKAFLQGDKSSLSRETISLFRSSGAAHLLALSGLHMGIIYFVFDRATKWSRKKRSWSIIRYIVLVVLASFYTLIVGAKPSICRAFLFIVLRETYLVKNFKPVLSDIFFMALFIQLAIIPSVITSIGFQLSYLAVAGIVFIAFRMMKWYDGNKVLKFVWDSMCIALCCQMMTAPLAYYYFGTFPKYFMLSNLIAIPLTIGFIWCSIGCILLSVLGICPTLLYNITDGIGDLLLFSLKVIGSLG